MVQLPMSTDDIEGIIPHRFPMLLVDRVEEIGEGGTMAVGVKNVTANEWFFQGHFPGRKIMPGVLIVEAMAQLAAVALLDSLSPEERGSGKLPLFTGIESMKFRKPVVPGDQLKLEFRLERMRGPVGKGAVKATVEDKLVAEGVISFALADPAKISG